ncbi:MAG: hypothetical protein JNK82_00405 [Myxococcaceae bacterium]|nr:hypothetical protein [Myxococcaceae bacterium]
MLLVLLACGTRPTPFDAGLDTDAGSDAGDEADAGTAVADAGTVVDAGALVDAGTLVDLDRDGLDDALEARLAVEYLPSLSLHPNDECPLGGMIYRARPHPMNPALVFIVYSWLFERDCGIGSHVGDNEAFGVTINPARPPPLGLTAVKAISHQNTLCQKVTACGACAGLDPCEAGDGGRPRLYSSRNKHAGYVQKKSCVLLAICTDDCAAGERFGVPLVNVGEPGAHLVEDLTDAGFITADAGWTRAEVFHFNPWGPDDFGGAGAPAGDLVDPAFDTPACL